MFYLLQVQSTTSGKYSSVIGTGEIASIEEARAIVDSWYKETGLDDMKYRIVECKVVEYGQ